MVNFTTEMDKIISECTEKVLSAELGELYRQITDELEISILLTDDNKIQELNRDYREKDKSTDVLSFPQYESLAHLKSEVEIIINSDTNQGILLGDVVVSLETCVKQAKEYCHSVERELGFLVVHGMLHLLGYDHMTEEEKALMRSKEEHVLTSLSLER